MISSDWSAVGVAADLEASGFDGLLDDVVTWLAARPQLTVPEEMRVAFVLLDMVSNGSDRIDASLLATLAQWLAIELLSPALLPSAERVPGAPRLER